MHGIWAHNVIVAAIRVAARGDGLALWWAVILPDFPVYLLWIAAASSPVVQNGNDYFWSQVFPYWLFLSVGSVQWGLFTWLALALIGKGRKRVVTVYSESENEPENGTGSFYEHNEPRDGR